jgi:RNA polymerase sigma factor (sigma-70 family)
MIDTNPANLEQRPDFSRVINNVQDYLRGQLEHLAPDSLLLTAWEQFYPFYNAVIRNRVRQRNLSADDENTVVQEVWCNVTTCLPEFQSRNAQSGLRAWLYQLVKTKTVDVLRDRSSVAQPLESAFRQGEEPASMDSNPGNLFEHQLDREMVHDVLEQLRAEVSQENFRLITLRWFEERSVAEVAEILGLTPHEVECRQTRMFAKLRSFIAVYTGDGIGKSTKKLGRARQQYPRRASAPS